MDESKIPSRGLLGTSDLVKELEANPSCTRTGRMRVNRGYQRIVFAERISVDISRRSENIKDGTWNYCYVDTWSPLFDVRDFIEDVLLDEDGITEEDKYGLIMLLTMF